MQEQAGLTPGFMVIHANQMEQLRDLLVHWMQAHPLCPLEQEVILVQSNGMAQWLQQALAADSGLGIAAALQVSLPARFIWQAYRAVLQDETVAQQSPLDKASLQWRLMRLLPQLLDEPCFAPLRRFLQQDDELRKRYQLCQRIADIFDQYQVYRADWLADWAQGRDRIGEGRQLLQLEPGAEAADSDVRLQTLAWQARLWRELQTDIGSEALAGSRASVHPRFIKALQALDRRPAGLPRRVIVFGISSLPAQTLEALAAMARFCQVILCVHNPCQYYWGDIVADRDLLRSSLSRHRRRDSMPAQLDDNDLHQHAHPLLAAWGKQGRDYIALLQEHDNRDQYEALFAAHKQQVDLFHEEQPDSLLRQLQSDILNLRPLHESRKHWKKPVDVQHDESIRFHSAHSPQREVEVLHDQLLDRFARHPHLQPRDVIVMVPDIDRYAPHIQAVFGQFRPGEARYVPFALSDQGQRGQQPLLIALEMLLQLPRLRMTRSQLLTLLDVPALRQRFGVQEADLPLLQRWMEGAGIRWGLDAGQRGSLGLPDGLEQNTWAFGLRRMLAGYAMGQDVTLEGIESYGEVAGLEAAAAGPLYVLLEALSDLERELHAERTPGQWVVGFTALLERFFDPQQQEEQLLLNQLYQALERWQQACELGDFTGDLPLQVAREAWLEALDGGRDSQRFLAGAINFCTLMPMRSIPFAMVCLLGMNDGDYPRIQPPLDFDLMAGTYRPGDRSRREDDRYLMLEALLAARQMLYISWVGRNVQDNAECTPSVLVAQLRDHLAQGWQSGTDQPLDQALTCEHPLQPFSAAYFDGSRDGCFTYAAEWIPLHQPDSAVTPAAGPLPPLLLDEPLAPGSLLRFVRRPVQQFFAQRFKVYLQASVEQQEDDEPFALDALASHGIKSHLLEAGARGGAEFSLAAETARMQRSGALPLLGFGEQLLAELVAPLQVQLGHYLERRQGLVPDERQWLLDVPAMAEGGLGVPGLRAWLAASGLDADGAQPVLLQRVTGPLKKDKRWRWSRLLAPVFSHVLLHAAGARVLTEVYGEDGVASLQPMEPESARHQVAVWLRAWAQGMCEPLPVAFETALAWLQAEADGKDDDVCRQAACSAYEGGYQHTGELDRETVLQRQFAGFDSLLEAGFEQHAAPLYRLLLDLEPGFAAYPQAEEEDAQ